MRCRMAIDVMVAMTLLSMPLTVFAAEGEAKKPMTTTTSEKTTARPSRDTREGKTVTPADAEFLQRPLASQLVTVNPSGAPQLTVMWFRYEDGALLFTTTTAVPFVVCLLCGAVRRVVIVIGEFFYFKLKHLLI